MSTITVSSTSLIDLTEGENRELQGLSLDISIAMKGLRYALVDMGKACIRAHEILAPKRSGAFAEWVDHHTEVSLGWAYGAMRVYREFGNIAPGCKIDSKALLLLASPSVPEEARQAAIEESQVKPVTGKRAKEIVSEHRMDVAQPGAADFDRGIEPDVSDEDIGGCDPGEDEPDPEILRAAPRQAKASGPVEPNEIGHLNAVIDEAMGDLIEQLGLLLNGKPEFQFIAARERLGMWTARL